MGLEKDAFFGYKIPVVIGTTVSKEKMDPYEIRKCTQTIFSY